jgi:hypothetical protein
VDSLRFVVCRRAEYGQVFFVCRRCDRGQQYCTRNCWRSARRHKQREAGRRHQRSRAGRFNHAARAQDYRDRRKSVTRHGPKNVPRSVEVVLEPARIAGEEAPDGRIVIRDPGASVSMLVTAARLSAMRPTGEAVFSFPEEK